MHEIETPELNLLVSPAGIDKPSPPNRSDGKNGSFILLFSFDIIYMIKKE